MPRPNVLVNLPPGFFTHAALGPAWARLRELAEVRTASCNTPEEIAPLLPWANSVLMWSWPKLLDEQLDLARNLRFAAHLDLTQAAARVAARRGLPISHGRYGWSPAVAEMALTLILSLLRRVGEYHLAMREGTEQWVRAFPDDIDPRERELAGRPVGIVGFGRIGRGLADLLAPFRCPISVYDPFVASEVLSAYGGHALELSELFARNDIVVLSAASNAGTNRLIRGEHLEAMRPGSVLVNVCRAALVDTDALVARLRRGDISAAIDVFDTEPCPLEHPLRKLPNAYLTPHRAGGLIASVTRIITWLIDDTEAFFGGRERRHNLHPGMIDALDA